MQTIPPSELEPPPIPGMIPLCCPECQKDGKNGLLGYVHKHDLRLHVQNAVRLAEPQRLVDVILYCAAHKLRVTYMVT